MSDCTACFDAVYGNTPMNLHVRSTERLERTPDGVSRLSPIAHLARLPDDMYLHIKFFLYSASRQMDCRQKVIEYYSTALYSHDRLDFTGALIARTAKGTVGFCSDGRAA